MLKHVIVKPVKKGSLASPESTKLILTSEEGVKIYHLMAPEGYTCLGNIILKNGESLDTSGYCCPKNEYLIEAAEQKLRYLDNKSKSFKTPGFNGWIVSHIRNDPNGVIASTFNVQDENSLEFSGKRPGS